MGELDLLITAVGEYTANSGVALNGVSGHFASIHVAVGVQNMFSFTFVESGTTTPVLLEDSVYVTVYDVDASAALTLVESVTSCDHAELYLSEPTALSAFSVSETCFSVSSTSLTELGSVPEHPEEGVTSDELMHSATLRFEGRSSFELSLGTTCGSCSSASGEYRAFVFAFSPLAASAATGCTTGTSPLPAAAQLTACSAARATSTRSARLSANLCAASFPFIAAGATACCASTVSSAAVPTGTLHRRWGLA